MSISTSSSTHCGGTKATTGPESTVGHSASFIYAFRSPIVAPMVEDAKGIRPKVITPLKRLLGDDSVFATARNTLTDLDLSGRLLKI